MGLIRGIQPDSMWLRIRFDCSDVTCSRRAAITIPESARFIRSIRIRTVAFFGQEQVSTVSNRRAAEKPGGGSTITIRMLRDQDWTSGDSTMQFDRLWVIFSHAPIAVSRDIPVIRARHRTVRPWWTLAT